MNKNPEKPWHLWSKQGSLLLYIALNPDSTVQDLADGIGLTQRSVWDHISDLRRAGMIETRRDGRRHRYRVNLDGPFRHPHDHRRDAAHASRQPLAGRATQSGDALARVPPRSCVSCQPSCG